MPRWATVALNLTVLAGCLGVTVWALFRSLKRSEDPSLIVFKSVISLVFTVGLLWFALTTDGGGRLIGPGLCALYGVTMAILWGRHIGALVAKPFTSMFDGGDEEVEPQPLYSIAINKIRRGQYQEAAFDIKEQLKKFPTDFTGQRLLAQLQAEHLNDLAGAQVTIDKLCTQPSQERSAVASVLNELADWHLKFGQDVDSARATLERIIETFPDSEFAQHAHQRIAHLANPEMLIAAHDRPAIRLRPGVQNIGLQKGQPVASAAEKDPKDVAREYVAHLEQHPHDNETREKLAWVYAREFGRPDLAVDQMDQIIEQPGLDTRHTAHCLNTIADMQIQYAHDFDAARAALQRIIDRFPQSPVAEAAQNRIDRLRLEMRSHHQNAPIKLGVYEQNIGLKKSV